MKLSRDRIEKMLGKGVVSSSGNDLYTKCPKCNQKEFGISLVEDNNPFNCFRKKKCGWSGNIYDILKFYGQGFQEQINVDKIELIIDVKEPLGEIEIEEVNLPLGWIRIKENKYLSDRGFVEYDKYKVGTSNIYKNYVIFLIEMNGKLVGWTGRRTNDKLKIPKYYNCPTTKFEKLLMGIDDVSEGDSVILVEGIFDHVSVNRELKLPQNHWSCCCTHGGKFTDDQMGLLEEKEIDNIFLLHENDILEKIKKEGSDAMNRFNIMVGYVDAEKDPDLLKENELLDILENAKHPIDFNNSYVKIQE